MKLCLQCRYEFESASWLCPSCGHEPLLCDEFPLFAPELSSSTEGFDPEAFKRLHTVEAQNFWFRVRNDLICWAIGKYFPSAKRFMEIGCGTGFVLSAIEARFPELNCSGSELHAEGLKFADSRLERSPLWQMDARNIPFRGEFDLIGAFDVLEHIREDETVLRQMHQALRPPGGILLTVPQHPSLWSHADEVAHHERRYTAKELQDKVIRAGFAVVRSTSFVSLLLPLMAASRLKERFGGSGSYAELELPESTNRVLSGVMRLESASIRRGLNFPAGGSLLMVAKRED